MALTSDHGGPQGSLSGWFARLIARPEVQRLASRVPLVRGMAARDGAEIFDILQGFVASQVLLALVEGEVLKALLPGPARPEALALSLGVSPDRARILLQGGAALGLLKRKRDGRFALARKGAAILGVPGLCQMIRHNRAFYDDLADPLALLRGAEDTALQRFWPYVYSDDVGGAAAEQYSDLMAQSQGLVAEDTLATVSLKGVRRLMDVGGGTGVFLSAALARYPEMQGVLLDLPAVLQGASARFQAADQAARVSLRPGSFREDALPSGADAVSLVRVLYDHDDATVRALLASVYAALPAGGRLIVSEPMAGAAQPLRSGDLYFAFYTMAMGTGRARSPDTIAALCAEAGFTAIRAPRARRPYVTGVVTCSKS